MRPILCLALASSLAGIGKSDEPALSVRIGQTVEISRSHGRCWFPTIHRFRSGEILVSMSLSPDQHNGESYVSAYCISLDGGLTWSRRNTMGLGAVHDGAWSEAPDADDTIWHFATYLYPVRDGDDLNFVGELTKYSRGGRHTTEDIDSTVRLDVPAPRRPTSLSDYRFDRTYFVHDTKFTTGFGGHVWGNILSAPDGALLCTVYYSSPREVALEAADQRRLTDPTARSKLFNHVILLRSTDHGRSWSPYGTIAALPPSGERAAWVGDEGYNETSLAWLPDRRLYAVYRTTGRYGQIGHSWSSDGGKTWTAPASTGVPGVAPRIHRMSNGALVMATGRPGPVILWFNLDGQGRKWSHPVTIYTEMSTRYCDLLEVAPGRLLVVYDSVPYGWYEIPLPDANARNRILGTFVDVQTGSSSLPK